jgi:hypothetical protein
MTAPARLFRCPLKEAGGAVAGVIDPAAAKHLRRFARDRRSVGPLAAGRRPVGIRRSAQCQRSRQHQKSQHAMHVQHGCLPPR